MGCWHKNQRYVEADGYRAELGILVERTKTNWDLRSY